MVHSVQTKIQPNLDLAMVLCIDRLRKFYGSDCFQRLR